MNGSNNTLEPFFLNKKLMYRTIFSFIKSISWTPLKISIIINIVLAVVVIFLMRSEDPKTEIVIRDRTITIPAKSGQMDTVFNPFEFYKVPIVQTIKNPINKKLLEQYNQLTDSIAKHKFVESALSEREYNEIYEDSNVTISIYTKVVGKMLKQAPNYTVKPITIVEKDTVSITYNKPATNKLLGGLEIGIPTGEDVIFKGNIYFQNKESNMITIGFDSKKTVWGGYIFKF